jgi:hypothetical protein
MKERPLQKVIKVKADVAALLTFLLLCGFRLISAENFALGSLRSDDWQLGRPTASAVLSVLRVFIPPDCRSCARRSILVSLCEECAGSALERNITLTSGAALALTPLCVSFRAHDSNPQFACLSRLLKYLGGHLKSLKSLRVQRNVDLAGPESAVHLVS